MVKVRLVSLAPVIPRNMSPPPPTDSKGGKTDASSKPDHKKENVKDSDGDANSEPGSLFGKVKTIFGGNAGSGGGSQKSSDLQKNTVTHPVYENLKRNLGNASASEGQASKKLKEKSDDAFDVQPTHDKKAASASELDRSYKPIKKISSKLTGNKKNDNKDGK